MPTIQADSFTLKVLYLALLTFSGTKVCLNQPKALRQRVEELLKEIEELLRSKD